MVSMIFTTAISKEVKIMNNLLGQNQNFSKSQPTKITRPLFHFNISKWSKKDTMIIHPFWVIVNKEISDHVKSWRSIILIAIIALTCLGSLYTALTNFSLAVKPNDPDGSFFFLKSFLDLLMTNYFLCQRAFSGTASSRTRRGTRLR